MFKLLITIVLITASSVVLAKREQVEYSIRIDQPQHHMGIVTIHFPKQESKLLNLHLPAWRSGRYQILNLASGIREFTAKDSSGKSRPWKKLSKSHWQVESQGKPMTIRYQIYANELGDRTRHIDDSHAFLDASAVFMYTPEFRYLPLRVNLHVPDHWRSRSGMAAQGRHQFKAPSYDVLIDSPIESGVHEFRKFKENGRQYEVLFWGKGDYHIDNIVRDLAKLDSEVGRIWEAFPYKRYLYMIHATDGARGATEHLNSTVIQRQRHRFSDRKDYVDFLLTAAHELVHTWNVKAYRPSSLVPYDFQNENYSTLLWLVEGSTSYFDDLVSFRAGIITEKEFLKQLAKSVEAYLSRPGNHVQAVAESSFDKWIESTNDFTVNHGVNIYSQGAMVSWLLDAEIQKRTESKKSYETIHRLLYKKHSVENGGFTEDNLLEIINEITDSNFSDFWRDYIHGTKTIDVDALLKSFGLKIKRKPKKEQIIDLGYTLDSEMVLTRVLKGSSAWKAGFTVGDRLVAMDGLRLTKKNHDKRLEQLVSGSKVVFDFFRRDELNKLTLKVTLNRDKKLEIEKMDRANKSQKIAYSKWTRNPWDAPTDKDSK